MDKPCADWVWNRQCSSGCCGASADVGSGHLATTNFRKKELAGDGLTHPGNTQSGRLAFSIYGISSVEQALQRHVTQKL
jgi:hypothetical protein